VGMTLVVRDIPTIKGGWRMMPKLSSRINFNYKNKVYYFNCQEVIF